MKLKVVKPQKYRLVHTDPQINELFQNPIQMDSVRLGLRDYTNARDAGETHESAYEYIEHRFARFNDRLLPGMSIEEIKPVEFQS